MKKMNRMIALTALGVAITTGALAQEGGPGGEFGPPGGPGGGRFGGRPPALTAGQLSTNYAALAVYDVNKDGKLDATEQAAVAQALVDGKLPPPGRPRGRDGGTPPTPTADLAQHLAAQMAAVYAALAPYDANKDAQLDTTEQAAVTQALADGTLKLPMGGPGGGRRGGRPGGPGGPGRFQPPSGQ